MDPASIIGVASAAIAFLDFAIELVKGSHEVYSSLDGSTKEHAHVDLVISDLQSAAATLSQHTPRNAHTASQHAKALADLGAKCHKKCTELLEITTKLKIHDRSKWSSFKAAWNLRWKKGDIDHMHAQLRDYRLAILLRLNQMQIENDIQADAKLDAILREFRRPIRDEHQIEASICSRIKHQLYFKTIYRREDDISDPGEDTFDWITDQSKDYSAGDGCEVPSDFVSYEHEARCNARSEYLSWLGHGVEATQSGTPETVPLSPRILHISGKAGSGKSTLMRHLFRHDQTRRALETWAGSGTLVLASFYFWVASGDDMQKSLEGLYRTILHDVLHKCPELAVYLFPSQWQAIQGSIDRNEEAKDSADAVLFRDKAIKEAFSKLTGPTASGSHFYFFCFFIDGLDEYRERASSGGGDRKDLAPGFRQLATELLRWNKAAHIKFCTTSRPHTEFLDPLRRDKATVLQLDGLNQCDIYRYCKTTFDQNDDIKVMQLSYDDLVSEITRRAEGVFLWAALTVQALITSLSRGDSKELQMKKLDAIPSELDNLYTMLLGRVEESDRDRSNQILLFALQRVEYADIEFYVQWASYLDNVADADFPLSIPMGLTKQQRADRGRRLVNSLTHGILIIDKYQRVHFLHRTAYDYMRERKACGQLTSAKIDFDQVNDVLDKCDVVHNLHRHYDHQDLHMSLSYRDHQDRADTSLRLADMIRREARERYQQAHPDATAYPLLPIVAAIGLNIWGAFDPPIAVDDGSVPILEVSMQCYSAILVVRGFARDRYKYFAEVAMMYLHMLSEEDRIAFDLFCIYALDQDGDSRRSIPDIYLEFLEIVIDTRSFKLGNQHCSFWAFTAVILANHFLRSLIYDSAPSAASHPSLSRLSYGITECKVTLNDRRHTVTTLKNVIEASSMPRSGYFGHNETPWLDLNPEERLDIYAAYLSAEELTERMEDELYSELDGELHANLDDGIDWEKMRDKIYFRSIELQGYELDSGFKSYVAVPDLFK